MEEALFMYIKNKQGSLEWLGLLLELTFQIVQIG